MQEQLENGFQVSLGSLVNLSQKQVFFKSQGFRSILENLPITFKQIREGKHEEEREGEEEEERLTCPACQSWQFDLPFAICLAQLLSKCHSQVCSSYAVSGLGPFSRGSGIFPRERPCLLQNVEAQERNGVDLWFVAWKTGVCREAQTSNHTCKGFIYAAL